MFPTSTYLYLTRYAVKFGQAAVALGTFHKLVLATRLWDYLLVWTAMLLIS